MLCVQWKCFAARTKDVDIAQEQTTAVASPPVDMDVRETLIRAEKGVLPVPALDSRQPSIRFGLLYSIAIYKQITYTASSLHPNEFRRCLMATGSVFENNRTQAVRLPAETRFPAGVKKVKVRVLGCDRVLSPLDQTWDSFFLADDTEDVHIERGEQGAHQEREPLE